MSGSARVLLLMMLTACGHNPPAATRAASASGDLAAEPPAPAPAPALVQVPAVSNRAAATWQPEDELTWPPPVEAVAFSPNGEMLAVGAGPGLWVVEVASWAPRFLRGDQWVEAVEWMPTGSALSVTDRYYGAGRGTTLVDPASGRDGELPRRPTDGWPAPMAYSLDLSVFVAAGNRTVSVRTAAGGSSAAETHRTYVHRLAATTVSAASADGEELWLWSLAPLTRKSVIPWEVEEVTQLLYSPDGAMLAAASSDGSVLLVDVAMGTLRATLAHAGHIADVAFSADGQRLATTCDDGASRVWSLEETTPALLRTIGHGAPVQAVDLTSDGRLLATGGDDGRLRVYDVGTGAEVAVIVLDPPSDR